VWDLLYTLTLTVALLAIARREARRRLTS